MAHYKMIDTSPRFLAVDLERQLLPGTFEHAIMAKRVALSCHDQRKSPWDNPSGSFMPAACNNWHDVRRFPIGTGHTEPTYDAGYEVPFSGYDCMRNPPTIPIDQS
jgi:hypothetical protein